MIKKFDFRSKKHLVHIIRAYMQTKLFSKEEIQKFIEATTMKFDTAKNDVILAKDNYEGYSACNIKKDNSGKLSLVNYIVINKKKWSIDYTIIHEILHILTTNYKIIYRKGLYELNIGFITLYYDKKLRLIEGKSIGKAFNEGFAEILNSIVNESYDNCKNKTKEIDKKCNKEKKKLGPYGFEFDECDIKNDSIITYPIYKKMAELLNLASEGKALGCFKKGDANKFSKEFELIMGKGYFKKLLLTLDKFDSRYWKLFRQHSEEEVIDSKVICRDKELTQFINNGTSLIIEYFDRNLENQINKGIAKAELVNKLAEFEKMLPKEICNSLWNEKKSELLHTFENRKNKNVLGKEKLMCNFEMGFC